MAGFALLLFNVCVGGMAWSKYNISHIHRGLTCRGSELGNLFTLANHELWADRGFRFEDYDYEQISNCKCP